MKDRIFAVGLIVSTLSVRLFAGWNWVAALWFVVILPYFVDWLPLERRSGRLLLDLGRPRNRLRSFSIAVCALAGLMGLADLILEYFAGTPAGAICPSLPFSCYWVPIALLCARGACPSEKRGF
jgi:hypothetical protein